MGQRTFRESAVGEAMPERLLELRQIGLAPCHVA
jgi:hypothetical protein